MTNYPKLLAAMSTLASQTREPILIKPEVQFPFPTIYPEQQRIIQESIVTLKTQQAIAFRSHTGFGKTPTYLSLTRGIPTIVISPRKFLQRQVASYYGDFVLFGRSEYPCKYASNAATAPCQRKITCETTSYHESCPQATTTCLNKPCRVFSTDRKHMRYPCEGCEYIKAQMEASRVLKADGTVIANFGNFWQLLKHAKMVVIDEADLFFKEIAKPTRMDFSKPRENGNESILSILQREVAGLEKAKTTSPPSQVYSIQNKLYNAQFLLQHAELCFMYQRKARNGEAIYIEINPEKVGVLKDKLFHDKKLIIVSATLGEFNVPSFEGSIWQRRGIFFAPVGKMTSRELNLKPWLMTRAAESIENICALAEATFDTHQFVVHCGNIGTHATQLNELLGPDRDQLTCAICGEKIPDISPEEQEIKCPKCNRKWTVLAEQCTMHRAGNLMQTIESYLASGKRYLLIASAEYGADFGWNTVQIVLKYPYSTLDPRMRTLEKIMGKQKFNAFYKKEARNRIVQQCGRNVRGFGDFGVTVVLDSKFLEEYKSDKAQFPAWFRESFDEKTY